MRDPVTSPGYVVLEIAHILCAVIGFGALGATGAYANGVIRSADPFSSTVLRRFFRPGHNLASGAVGLVPLLGAALLIAGHGQDVHLAYPWIGLALWSLAASVAFTVIWPAEREIQRRLAAASGEPTELAGIARRCSIGATVTSACFLAALVVMIGQP